MCWIVQEARGTELPFNRKNNNNNTNIANIMHLFEEVK